MIFLTVIAERTKTKTTTKTVTETETVGRTRIRTATEGRTKTKTETRTATETRTRTAARKGPAPNPETAGASPDLALVNATGRGGLAQSPETAGRDLAQSRRRGDASLALGTGRRADRVPGTGRRADLAPGTAGEADLDPGTDVGGAEAGTGGGAAVGTTDALGHAARHQSSESTYNKLYFSQKNIYIFSPSDVLSE